MVVGGGVEGVTLDRDDESGEVAVADDPPELLLGDEHAGGVVELRTEAGSGEEMREFLSQLIERLVNEGYLAPQQPQITAPPAQTPGGSASEPGPEQQGELLSFSDNAWTEPLASWQRSPYRAMRQNALQQLIAAEQQRILTGSGTAAVESAIASLLVSPIYLAKFSNGETLGCSSAKRSTGRCWNQRKPRLSSIPSATSRGTTGRTQPPALGRVVGADWCSIGASSR